MYLCRAVDLPFRYSGLRLVDTYDTIMDYHSGHSALNIPVRHRFSLAGSPAYIGVLHWRRPRPGQVSSRGDAQSALLLTWLTEGGLKP